MNSALRKKPGSTPTAGERASVLIIVLWIAFGLVALALYFADSMNFELRAADNRVSAMSADEAIDGAVRYINYLLTTLVANGSNGFMPVLVDYQSQAVPVGEAHFWLLGRDTNALATGPGQLSFGLVDESSKLNLNTASSNTLYWLPRMTVDLTQSILDWRDTNANGPTVTYYAMQQPPYMCKSDPFETVDELRLLYGADMDILLGEDANRNGVLDPSENDDNQNHQLDPGLLEYVTVYSREPNTNSSGSAKINVSSVNLSPNGQLGTILRNTFGQARATQILTALGGGSAGPGGGGPAGPGGGGGGPLASFSSPLRFFIRSRMTSSEFAQIGTNITATGGTMVEGRVNVNSASVAVLTCLTGGDAGAAQTLVSYRQLNPNNLTSIAWVVDALGQNSPDALNALAAGDFLTTQSYQCAADIAALGPHGRGYRRVRLILDTSTGTPQIVYRQDLTHLGWALGKEVRQTWLLAKGSR